MKVPKIPENINIHPNVIRTIKKIAILDDKKAISLIQRIMELSHDPLPDNEECTSETVLNLKKQKVPVQRLKCVDIKEYRIFYSYKRSGVICVYYLVTRDSDTYNKNSFHYKIIKLLYAQWKECQ